VNEKPHPTLSKREGLQGLDIANCKYSCYGSSPLGRLGRAKIIPIKEVSAKKQLPCSKIISKQRLEVCSKTGCFRA